MINISIHAPHTGRDSHLVAIISRAAKFQSTRPIRGATRRTAQVDGIYRYFNPRAPYGARRPGGAFHFVARSDFNPRAPYGARSIDDVLVHTRVLISIHAPHTGRDSEVPGDSGASSAFQSTRPIRGATLRHQRRARRGRHFNPRAPYGARPGRYIVMREYKQISIHAPHTGRDVTVIS